MSNILLFAGGLFILLVLGYTGTAMAGFAGATTPDFDHFKCYEAEAVNPVDPPNIGFVGLSDQFETVTDTQDPQSLVTTPDLFCNPVDKEGDDLKFRDTDDATEPNHLLCYKISTELPGTLTIEVTNQFRGGASQFIEVEDSNLLCLPTRKIECRDEDGNICTDARF